MDTRTVQSGMTLLELLLYFAIASALVVVLFDSGIDLLRAADRGEHQHELNQDMLGIASQLRSTAMEATAISTPVPGEHASAVAFAMPDPARDPTRFFLADGVLFLAAGEQAAVPLHGTGSIAGASFLAIDQAAGIESLHASVTLQASTSQRFGAEQSAAYSSAFTLPF